MYGKAGFGGRRHSESTKQLMRVRRLEALARKDIVPGVDRGANEWFNAMNKQGFCFVHPNFPIKELGFFLDAYDPIKRIAAEYDSRVHRHKKYRESDPKRQQAIIDYFNAQGCPLSQFIRIDGAIPGKEKVRVVYAV
jgi:hypothetical protein